MATADSKDVYSFELDVADAASDFGKQSGTFNVVCVCVCVCVIAFIFYTYVNIIMQVSMCRSLSLLTSVKSGLSLM